MFGRLCSGKGTFCQKYIKQGYTHITTSDIVRAVSGKSTRSELTKTGDLDTKIAEEMIGVIESQKPIVIDGIRQTSIVESVLQHFGEENVEMIWLEVPANVRRERFTNRAAAKDDQSFDDAEQSDSKLGIDDLETSIKSRTKIVDFH
ncbi:MAG: AAA family ATPase [Neptunomonas phycophila]|uniref:AAA family ATPase n=1 Tax=Neptunomonas phycophila TaxID=1572645 RepID=UPI003B8AB062